MKYKRPKYELRSGHEAHDVKTAKHRGGVRVSHSDALGLILSFPKDWFLLEMLPILIDEFYSNSVEA